MESNLTERGKAAETAPGEHAKKPLTPIQTVLWTIGVLAALSAFFLAISLISPGN